MTPVDWFAMRGAAFTPAAMALVRRIHIKTREPPPGVGWRELSGAASEELKSEGWSEADLFAARLCISAFLDAHGLGMPDGMPIQYQAENLRRMIDYWADALILRRELARGINNE